MNTTQRGRWGETLAVIHLENKNTQVVARNWRWKRYEIDLVGRKNKTWVFVEGKVRRWGYREAGIEAVNVQKQRRIIHACAHFSAASDRHRLHDCIRFDIICIELIARNTRPRASNTLRMRSCACHDSVS